MSIQQEVRPRTRPRGPALDRTVAMRLAADEYDRVVELFAQLTDDQWTLPTDCPDWDVRAMAGHILGMAEMAASLRETVRQNAAARKRGGKPLDALTAHQVEKNAHLSTDQLIDRMRVTGPKAAGGRRRTPALFRGRTLPQQQQVGKSTEWWTFGYLFDVILTRDPFMHRIDITRAAGIPMRVEPEHEGVLVDDVVREWAERHDEPYQLVLTGPAGGTWSAGTGDRPRIEMDAVEFCRVLSGRAPGEGLLQQQVPF